MNDKQKAAEVLNYLEECDSTTTINVLSSLVSDTQLAGVYDRMHEEGII